MQNLNSSITCRLCQHYTLEGRRGGHCQQLGAFVKGSWQACSFVVPAFTSLTQLAKETKPPHSKIGYPLELIPSQRLVTEHLLRRDPSTSQVPSQLQSGKAGLKY